MEGIAAPSSEDSLSREAQGGARRYVSRHQVSRDAWSSPTLPPSPEAELTPSASVLSPHKFKCSGRTGECRWWGKDGDRR
jgi:hypothetical protein